MVTLKGHKRCDFQDPENPELRCYRQPSFNFFGSVGGIYCHQHKVLLHLRCVVLGCVTQFLQIPGMVNVVNKCCEHEGCVKRPSFNFPNIRPARFCGQVLIVALSYAIHRHQIFQHRVTGMVSTTIGYRSKTQLTQQVRRRQTANSFECCEELASTSPSHAQSSDNSAETEYRPYTQPAASPTFSTQSVTAPKSIISPVDLDIHRKACFGNSIATPSTITKRRGRIPASIEESNGATLSAQSLYVPSHNHPTANAVIDSEYSLPSQSHAVSLRTPPTSNSMASGITKKHRRISRSLCKEHKGMPVTQRVVDACRPPQLRIGDFEGVLPTANRTPVKSSQSAGPSHTSPCQILDSTFSDNSDSDDCFSERAHLPTALLDAFSPLRPRGQLSASESRDFELDFGWDPIVRNAVMKNAFNGFGAIRSH